MWKKVLTNFTVWPYVHVFKKKKGAKTIEFKEASSFVVNYK